MRRFESCYVGSKPRATFAIMRTAPRVAKRNALQQYVDTFFGGLLSEILTTLVRERSWEEGDVEALRQEIDKARKER